MVVLYEVTVEQEPSALTDAADPEVPYVPLVGAVPLREDE